MNRRDERSGTHWHWWMAACIALGLVATGCDGDDEDTTGDDGASTENGTGEADDGATSSPGGTTTTNEDDETSTSGEPDSTGAGDTDASGDGSEDPGSEGSTGAGGSSGSGGEAGVCDPQPDDDACRTCTKTSCCEELETCLGEPICECMSGCVTGPGDVQMCTEMCGETGNFEPLTNCVTFSCLTDCI